MINIKQKDGESLIDYTAKFESVQDIAVVHLGGTIVILKIIELIPRQQPNKRKLQQHVKDTWKTYTWSVMIQI